MVARSTAWRNSRMFPGHEYSSSMASASAESLRRAGRSSFWDVSLRLQTQTGPEAAERATFIEKIQWFLRHELVGGDVFVLKDPRISVLLDCWLKAADQAGFVCKVVHMVRHPEEVAASLSARDQLDRGHAYSLWLKYNLLSERYARGRPRIRLRLEVVGKVKSAGR